MRQFSIRTDAPFAATMPPFAPEEMPVTAQPRIVAAPVSFAAQTEGWFMFSEVLSAWSRICVSTSSPPVWRT